MSDSVTPWTVSWQAPLSMGFLQAKILEWVAISFSRGIFLTQGLNPGLQHCKQTILPPEPPGICNYLKKIEIKMYKDELLQLILVQNMDIHSHINQFSFTCYQADEGE